MSDVKDCRTCCPPCCVTLARAFLALPFARFLDGMSFYDGRYNNNYVDVVLLVIINQYFVMITKKFSLKVFFANLF